jgi:hypothetical protein
MKITKYLAFGLLALSLTPVWGQQVQLAGVNYVVGQPPATATNLTKFSLDFPGGTPKDLVAAIQKATGKLLNVIIPNEAADTHLPSLKMNNVDVPQLFTALGAASMKQENRVTSSFAARFAGSSSYSTFNTSYGFRTDNNSPPSDDSIWYFYIQNPPPAPDLSPPTPPTIKICRYYQLTPYLNSGLSVDDITTAIQTGWKMMGETAPPEINFHKETKLLIAVGEPDKLQVIDDALKALQEIAQYPNGHFAERLNSVVNRAGPPLSPRQPTPPPAAPDAGK